MTHPFITLLGERNIRRLWLGLSLSAIGDELYRVAVIWIAVQIGGSSASYLLTLQCAAVLVVGLVGGSVSEKVSPVAAMIGADLLRAVLSALPVVLLTFGGLNLPVLITSAVALAALRTFFDPALLSTAPHLVGTPERLQGLNGLLDATARLARFAGPTIAGFMSLVLPVIHLLTVNALSFIASAAAILAIAPALANRSEPVPVQPPLREALLRGFMAAGRDTETKLILAANTVVLALWTLALIIGLPMLFSSQTTLGVGERGLFALGLVLGAYGAGDLVSNVAVAAMRLRRRQAFMFTGYIVLGSGIALIPLVMALFPSLFKLPVMMVAAFIGGLGGPMFFLPMMTKLQTTYQGADLRAVIRLRLMLTSSAIMIGSVCGPWLFDTIGPAGTVGLAGLCILGVGAGGLVDAALRSPEAASRQP